MLTNIGILACRKFELLDFRYMAFGSGSASATPHDTALQNEIRIDCIARGETIISKPTRMQLQFDRTVKNTTADNITINEVGLFNSPIYGDMSWRYILPVTILEPGHSLKFTAILGIELLDHIIITDENLV